MKRIYVAAITLITLGPINHTGFAQQLILVAKLQTPPLIDGSLNDAAWQRANLFNNFKTLHPQPGQPPSERTEVRLAYDHENIYVGIHCYDSQPNRIKTTDGRPDNPDGDDWIAFCLDSYMDGLPGFFFMVAAGGQRTDGTLTSKDGNINVILNLHWSSATVKTSDGWTTEMSIPFKHLPFSWSRKIIMRFKVARYISRLREEVNCPPVNPEVTPHFSQFQQIEFSDVDHNSTANADLVAGLQETVQRRLKLAKELDTLTYEQRLKAWTDASVYDYLVYPSHPLTASSHPLPFAVSPQETKVEHLFEELEYDKDKPILNLEDFLQRTLTTSFIVIHNDTIIYEKYFYGFDRNSIVTSFSVAKSFVSTLVGIALDEGTIGSVNDPITKYLPELTKRDERFSRITIKDLLMMSAGLRYSEDEPYKDNDVTYQALDLRKAAMENTSIIAPPAKYFLYNDYHPILLGMILERATQSVTAYLQKKLWDPIGMEYSGSWSTNDRRYDLEKMLVGVNARAIDFAKLGRLFLNNGKCEGKQIVSEHWVEEATQPEEKPSTYYDVDPWFVSDGHYYKYFWWGDRRANGRNDFHAVGNKGQYVYVSPQKNLIIVRNGINYGVSSGVWLRLFRDFASRM